MGYRKDDSIMGCWDWWDRGWLESGDQRKRVNEMMMFMREQVFEIETVKRYQLITITWLRYWLENHKHAGWKWSYYNKVSNNSTEKENGRKMFVSFDISLWGNGNASIYPKTVFNISQFIFSPLLDGGSKKDVMKRMFRYPKE